jgi:mono/diheme cytochrome c family protein
MKRAICIGVAVAAVTTAVLGQGRAAGGQQSGALGDAAQGAAQAEMRRMLDTYCAGCHSSAVPAGGVAFDTLTLDAVHEHSAVWEATVRKLRGRLMPPPGSRQPDQREIDAFVSWMEATLDGAPGDRAANPGLYRHTS